jgi:hypothetical protein
MKYFLIISILALALIIVEPVVGEEIQSSLNYAPVLRSMAADKESPQVTGTAITWTASASDTESDPISYRFLVNGTPATDWQSENQWTWTAMQPGTSQITVQVKDSQHDGPQGESGNMSREFSIIFPPSVEGPLKINVIKKAISPQDMDNLKAETYAEGGQGILNNKPPVLHSLSPTDFKIEIGSSVTFNASATDPENDPLLFRFDITKRGSSTDWIQKNTWTSKSAWL